MKDCVAMLADFVDGADVGMIQGGSGAGFAAKTFERLRIAGEIVGQKFQRNEAAEFSVFGFVNHAHAAATEFFDDAVVRDGLVEHGIAGQNCGRVMLRRWRRGVNELGELGSQIAK